MSGADSWKDEYDHALSKINGLQKAKEPKMIIEKGRILSILEEYCRDSDLDPSHEIEELAEFIADRLSPRTGDLVNADGLLPCPFCGDFPPADSFYMNQGYKWGGVQCCIQGPEVRTKYDQSPNAPWHKDAIEAWNTRPSPEVKP